MKFLVIGLGGIGQRHVRNLRSLLGADVDLIAYRVRGLTRVLTEDFKIEPETELKDKYKVQEFRDLDKALAEKPNAMFVCNPSDAHLSAALAGAKGGCHLFIEKPLSHKADEIDELIELVEQKELVATVGYQLRYHPGLVQLRLLLQENVVGRVLSVNVEVGEYLPGFHPYEDYREMYASRAALGGGVVLSQIHELDYLYWLFGLPRRVFALGGHLSNLEVDVEDVASALMEFEVEGAVVPVQVHLDYIQRPPSRSCKVVGTNGKIILDFVANSLEVFGGDGKLTDTHRYEFQRNQMFRDELKHFLDCIERGERPAVTLRDAKQSLLIALAIKESIATGEVVSPK